MKLNIEQNRSQGDPYVIKSNGIYYMYSTHGEGVHLYSSKDKMNWDYRGIVFTKIFYYFKFFLLYFLNTTIEPSPFTM